CGDARACVRGGLGQLLGGAEAKCVARACASACGPYLAPPEEAADEDGPRKAAPGQPTVPRFDTPASAAKDL
ncbi:MAG TPA: hypothetical protein VIV59_02925, partial [Anaeromyxobacteraceae bacterium]